MSRTAAGIAFFGSRVSSPSDAAASNPMNRVTAKRMPWKIWLEPVFPGSSIESVRPLSPPWAITATIRISSGRSESALSTSCVRTVSLTPKWFIANTKMAAMAPATTAR